LHEHNLINLQIIRNLGIEADLDKIVHPHQVNMSPKKNNKSNATIV